MERDKRVRLFHLAKEWNVESKILLELCQQLGIGASNHSSGLDPDEVARLRDAVRTRSGQTAPQPSAPRAAPAKPVPTVLVAPVPAPVWNRALGASPSGATPKPVLPTPAMTPAPVPPVAPAPQSVAKPVPVAPVAQPEAPAPQPARGSGTRNPPSTRATPRTVPPPPQRKSAAPAPVPAPIPVPAPVRPLPVPHTGVPGPVVPSRNPGIDHLLVVGERAGLEELELVPRLAEIDTECAVFKLLQITERLCRKVLGARGPRQLDVMIGEIEQRNLLGKKAVSYLRHIQNLGAHATQNADESAEEMFTLLDVNNTAATLASVVEAALSAKRVGPK